MKKIKLALFLFLIFVLSCQSNKESTEGVPVLSVEESIKDFQIEDGFVIEPVCAEPLVEDPVAISFDADANMWIVEMRGYMQDKEGSGEDQPLGRIRILTDSDGDGKYDSARIFLDSLIMPRAVAIVNSGILLIEPPGLSFIENSNGKAGKRMVIDSAFAETGNVEHQPNGLLRGIDDWYYCSSSDKRVKNINGKWVIEKTSMRGQWGISMDDAGRLFYNNNSVMLMADNFLAGSFAINPNHRFVSRKISNVRITDNRVYPGRSTEGVNRGYQKDVLDNEGKLTEVTSACGPVIYRGDNFPTEFYGNAFVMEPAAFLIKRIVLSKDSSGLVQGKFAYANQEFLTATDERFRPVNAYNSPDGCLYFVDMHRGIIQHTTYMTPWLRRHIDSLKLDRPIGMGRIYRIRWKGKAASKPLRLSTYNAEQLIDLLKHPNAFYRDMAHQLLVERNDPSVSEALMKLVVDRLDARAALHALWILDQMGNLNPALLKIIATAHPGDLSIYQSCLQLLGQSDERDIAFEIYLTLRKKNNRIAEVCFLGGLHAFQDKHYDRASAIAFEILASFKNDPLVTDAFISRLSENEKITLKKITAAYNDDTVIMKALNAVIKRRAQPKEDAAIAHLNRSERERFFSGKSMYLSDCSTCHGKEGEGMPGIAPPLAGSEWVMGEPDIPIKIVLDGLTGPMDVNGTSYAFANAMPGLRNNIEKNNGDMAAVLTYIRNAFGNKASAITVEQIGKTRAATENRTNPYTVSELKSSY